MSASIALQILPTVLEDAELCRIVDTAIEKIQDTGLSHHVGPFETSVEGADLDTLMDLVKDCILTAAEAGAPEVNAYLKVAYRPDRNVLTIDQKIGKYQP